MTPLDKLHAQLHRAHISQRDFEEAESYLNMLPRTAEQTIHRGLLAAAVVAYARPFTDNESSRLSAATPRAAINPAKELEPEELQVHSKVLELRNRAIAHSEYASRPVRRAGTDGRGGLVLTETLFDVLKEDLPVLVFREICRKLAVACSCKKTELNGKLAASGA